MNHFKQLDAFEVAEGERLKEEGIATAEEHAENVYFGWNEKAFILLKDFLNTTNGEEFVAEDFRAFCRDKPLPEPPTNRAFGGVIIKAKKAGLIVAVGIGKAKDPKSHRGFTTIWRRA